MALQQAFKTLDLNGDGVLSEEELTTGMMKFLKVNKREAGVIASAVFKKIDVNRSGSIDYSGTCYTCRVRTGCHELRADHFRGKPRPGLRLPRRRQ